MKNVLLIAYHFPPLASGSGRLRTLAFARYLPDFGWEPTVLSVHPRAYTRIDKGSLTSLPEGLGVTRAFALDARRHLSIRNSYPLILAQPDRWSTWWLGAVPAGLKLIRRYRPEVIWSTYPIATAHLIAHTLHRMTGLPWVADFRDPVTDDDIGSSALTRYARAKMEKKTIKHSACNVFTTNGAARLYAERNSWRDPKEFVVIPNGYDDMDFANFSSSKHPIPEKTRPLRLLHAGVLYRKQRDPTAFFEALGQLAANNAISPDRVQVLFRSDINQGYYRKLIKKMKVEQFVQLKSSILHKEALREQSEADGLLLFQGSEYNSQIPAKTYEYLRIGRPILALTDPEGETAAMLRSARVGLIAEMTSREAIVPKLRQFLSGLRQGTLPVLASDEAVRFSRHYQTGQLAELLDKAAAKGQ